MKSSNKMKINHKENKIMIKENIHSAESLTTMDTKLGKIQYRNEDIFYFHDGIVGFPGKTKFSLTDVPGVPREQRYGLLQSLDDIDLSFVLHYPVLDEKQQDSILKHIQRLTDNAELSKNDIGYAFLVLIEPDENQLPCMNFLTDAPLVFLGKTHEAWHMIQS